MHDGAFGTMVALRGTDIVRVPLAEATSELKTVPPERYAEAEVLFGCCHGQKPSQEDFSWLTRARYA